MKKLLLFLGVTALSVLTSSAYRPSGTGFQDNVYQYTNVSVKPTFQGQDIIGFTKWVITKVQESDKIAEIKASGNVILEFIVDENGKVTEVKVLRSPDPALSDEMVKIVSSSPEWVPGKHGNRIVKTKIMQNIRF